MRTLIKYYLCLLLVSFVQLTHAALPIETIQLPPGFEITVFGENIKGARSLALGDKGTLFVGTRSEGKVYAITHNGEKAQQVYTIAADLKMPNGVAFRNGSLYVAEVNRVLRFDAIESQLQQPPKPVIVTQNYPSEAHHGWKFIRFGSDGKLYIPIGAPCNICDRGDPYASITRIDVNQADAKPEIIARGIRNTVGFDWHPQTGELWFTENGRDMLGDDVPPEELNRLGKVGQHFGYPYCHAGSIADPEFGKVRKCEEFVSPGATFQAHSAALGMRFYNGNLFPDKYRNRIFIAQHGSWNRSTKVGAQLVTVDISKAGQPTTEVFAKGWLQGNNKSWGAPVDVLVMPDGAVLVSDDQANAIYRISYRQ